MNSLILLCYDGSADAQAAIDHSALLMPGSQAKVLVIWETIMQTMTRNGSIGMGFGMVGLEDDTSADAAIEQRARDIATEGAQRASAAGLVAQPIIATREGDIAQTILSAAMDHDASVIILGTRGLGSVKSLMLGSVSHAVLHHADRAVLVVPSPGLAVQRRHWSERTHSIVGIT